MSPSQPMRTSINARQRLMRLQYGLYAVCALCFVAQLHLTFLSGASLDHAEKIEEDGGSLSSHLRRLSADVNEKTGAGGNAPQIVRMLRFWNDIPEPVAPSAPIYNVNAIGGHAEKYLTWEPYGGFNNIRMQLETVFILAHILNRTLVLPPSQNMYLLGSKGYIADFFDDEGMKSASGVRVIHMEEYLDRRGIVADSKLRSSSIAIRDYNRAQCELSYYCPTDWDMSASVIPFPSPSDAQESNAADFSFPTMDEFAGFRKRMVEVSRQALTSPTLHFITKVPGGPRLFGTFYTWMYFADVRWSAYYVQLVQKHLHYSDPLIRVSSHLISSLLSRNEGQPYYAMHIRRGDFQFKKTRIDALTMLANVKPLFPETGRILYIATDEKDKAFFAPFRRFWDVRFLGDYTSILDQHDMNHKRHLGMIDQLVCVGAERFIGTHLSTFTAYIHRIRSFVVHPLPGVFDTNIYFTTSKYSSIPGPDAADTMATWIKHDPHRVAALFWAREFPYFYKIGRPPLGLRQ